MENQQMSAARNYYYYCYSNTVTNTNIAVVVIVATRLVARFAILMAGYYSDRFVQQMVIPLCYFNLIIIPERLIARINAEFVLLI